MQTTNPKIKMKMKKLVLGAAMLLLAQVGFGQAVNESAIIPVSVTLNAVSRLNVESGGNIKFVFTSINDYNTGFTGEDVALYRTTVSVASSRDFSVNMYAESDEFQPTDDSANTLSIESLDYRLEWRGGPAPGTIQSAYTQMSDTPFAIISGGLAGDGEANRFDIYWRLGTPANQGGTLLDRGDIAADHYVANIFIELAN